MKAIFVTIHGQESNGKNMKALSDKLEAAYFTYDCAFVNIRYTKLLTIVNTLPWVRTMTAKYIASRLETIKYKFPEAAIIVAAHSNGTRATSIAMKKRNKARKSKSKYPDFRIDHLLLLGCPIKRSFDWSRFPSTGVINFISVDDKVVFMARLYGMGSAGRYGFKKSSKNLNQVWMKWGHSGFMKHYSVIKGYVKEILENL